MRPITTKISTLALVCLLLGVGSCSREDDFQSGGKLLKVNVQMAASPMLARGATTSPIISDTVDMGNDLVLVATSRPRDYEPQEALTRGTPIKSAANLPSLNVKVYNSGTASFSGSTALTATLKGTNSSGAWSLSPAYMIKEGDKNTYMAYSPIEDANNGIAVAANGRRIVYDARTTTVANQPDICSSTIVTDDVSGNLSLAMQHRLTAVGFKVSADNVTINEIKLNIVRPSGTLNLETGVWGDLTTTSSFTPTLTTTPPTTGGSMNDIIAANGYLMLPPQSFSISTQEVTVKYTYAGGTQETATFPLRNLTGGKWEAGQIVMYEIQLKAKFSLTFSPASLTLTDAAGTASFTYSTNSPKADDPKFDNGGNAWIKNVQINRSTKTVTFNYEANALSVARTATIKATCGWTEKDISIKQLSDPDLGSFIPRSVLAAAGWPTDRLPTKGLQLAMRGDKVKLGGTPAASDPTKQFSTVRTYTAGTTIYLGAGKNNTALLTGVEHSAAQYCRDMGTGWYLPSYFEWEFIGKNMDMLVAAYRFSAAEVWSSSDIRESHAACINLSSGFPYNYLKDLFRPVRCVREI